jgi:thiosulfate dehydrogenase [quinone] large subunit
MALRNVTPPQLGALALRLAIGINLVTHGFVRFGGNAEAFDQWMLKTFASSPLPPPLVLFSAHVIPLVELVLGLLLLIGFQISWVLFLAALEMCGLIFGMCLVQNWEIVGVQMVYVICYFLLLNSPHLRFASIDQAGAKPAR